MTIDAAAEFLKAHQPMADDHLLEQWELDVFKEIILWMLEDGVPDSLAGLLAGSLGLGTACGLHESTLDLLRTVNVDLIMGQLLAMMRSSEADIRYRGADLASSFKTELVIQKLKEIAQEDSDEDVREMAKISLQE